MELSSRTNKICAIINAHVDMEQLEVFKSMGLEYYAILHDRDTNKNGELKTEHVHLILVRSVRSMVKWFFTRICSVLHVNENQVSIMPCDNLTASIQYLIHKNDNDKYQYAPFDIYTSIDDRYLNEFLSKDSSCNEMSFEYLEDICIANGFNMLLIMKAIGVGRYNCFRQTINDFIREFKPEYERRVMEEEIKGINKDMPILQNS